MTVLMTGATGLLGANLARLLCSQGIRPRAIVRERSDRRGLSGLALDEVPGDLLDHNSLRRAMAGVEQVYHLAGTFRLDPGSTESLQRLHVGGTAQLLQAAKAAGVRRIVHVSSVAAVGHGLLSEPATETSRYNFPPGHPFHESKREGEAVALAASCPDCEVVVVNPGFLVGPYDVRPSSGELLLAVARGWVGLYPTGGNNFVNAADVARGMTLAMAKGEAGQRYILGGENLTYRQFLTLCAEEAGVRAPLLPAPERLLASLGRVGDEASRFLPELFKSLNSSLVRSMFIPAYYSSQKAMRALGYQPRPVRLGVRDAYRWFQEQKMLPVDRPLTPRDGAWLEV